MGDAKHTKSGRRDGYLVEGIAYYRYLFLCLVVDIGIAILFSKVYQLTIAIMIIVILVACIMSPLICHALCQNLIERKRFEDVNAYMQQFINGMLLHRRIMAALEDTVVSFPNGQMHIVLKQVIGQMQRNGDLRENQSMALAFIEQMYPNSQVAMIHDFALRIEQHGGEFSSEMELLKAKRENWEKRTENCQNQMCITTVSSIFLFVCMMVVCGVVQSLIPNELAITYSHLSQWSELFLLIIFYFFVYKILRYMAKGWLHTEKFMSQKQADKCLTYLEKKQEKNKKYKGVIYYMFFWKVRRELKYAVPQWLFDVCLLMQKFNLTVSITESVKTAPPILKRDIRLLLDRLRRNPSSVEPYLQFLEIYGIRTIKSTMRMLISIQNGASGNTAVQMEQLVSHNMDALDEMDDKRVRMREAGSVRFHLYPMIPCAIVMGGYLFTIVTKIFQMMTSMIG